MIFEQSWLSYKVIVLTLVQALRSRPGKTESLLFMAYVIVLGIIRKRLRDVLPSFSSLLQLFFIQLFLLSNTHPFL